MTESLQPNEQHPLAKLLRELEITRAAIIDDVYDSPTIDSFDAGEIDDFWASIDGKEEMLVELRKLAGKEITKREDIDDDVIRKLWREIGNLEKLVDPCRNQLFPTKLQDRADVDVLSEHLKNLDLVPVALGAEDDLPDPSIKLVFLDYFLNPGAIGNLEELATNPEAIVSLGELATTKAIQIYKQVENVKDKPFIVLISSQKNVTEQKERFRQNSSLLSGLFGFIAKEDIRNRDKFYFKLSSLGIGNATHHAIQRFIDTLVESIGSTAEEFKKKVLALGIQDYAFIQRLSLHEEGHPLGDYILWLFTSMLTYIFRDFEQVRRQQNELDRLTFRKYLPCQNQPTTRLAEMYRYALTEPAVEELGPHPHDETRKMPFLQLGDIFIRKEDERLLLVINAACDLAFAPLASRQCDPEQPIFFVPGLLEPLHLKKYDRSFKRTDLFEYNGKAYRIIWDHQHVHSQKYGSVWSYLKDQGYSRKARLRLSYALQIQQNFANYLARIGMPVAPPIFESADVEVYSRSEGNKFTLVGESIPEGALLIFSGEKSQFILTGACLDVLIARFDEIAGNLESRQMMLNKGEKEDAKEKEKLSKKIERLGRWRTESYDLVQMTEEPRPLPKDGKMVQLDPELVGVCLEWRFEGEYQPNTQVLLNIRFRGKPERETEA